ncbi:DUF1801 domain-containing protein [Psychroserpens sp.]|uniref:DUF1801 domain-containing protein n=1 Tax=Psychroserpens sp. TaxID=2020870 RepID=UPI001B1C4863|nr:DUF1801 domain-containing protein [Psychroserpens sp.]MBO6607723.1 DUF1801 domain-containing protein [Psychroserpens sp.]MBO6630930.1 DUF1801 domain-containing protein [Psychroserpens sp.]MBO6654714.1 DUF1801 domain-containing protein [Psychroserpens sp.]MBO6682862.1 DUF1801 domain-containing protein [Psychroserpens sp.]MBO6751081.1 DUF1801 domain-containing protein [Psychroserpens sp.]
MQYKATSAEDYISQVPEERRPTLQKLRQVINDNLPEGFEEGIQYGMIGYYVPHSVYPDGYHCDPKTPLPFMSFASQKNSINLYHSGIYAKPELHDWWVNEYPKHSSRKLDMGKSCVRFKKIDDIPFELITELVQKMTCQEWIDLYEANIKKK